MTTAKPDFDDMSDEALALRASRSLGVLTSKLPATEEADMAALTDPLVAALERLITKKTKAR